MTQRRLDAHEARLDGRPVGLGHLRLQLSGLLPAPFVGELHDSHARAGAQVREARDGAVGAHRVTLEDEVCAAAANEEALGAVGHDARQLARVAARQLDAHHVGVLGDAEDGVGREIAAGSGAGEVVHEERDRALVGHVIKVLHNEVVGEQAAVVAGRENQGMSGARLAGVFAQLGCLLGALSTAAGDEGDASAGGLVEDGIPGDADDSGTLRV